MTNIPFKAFFPKKPNVHDEVVIRGKLKEDAQKISFNFCLDLPPGHPPNKSPPYIGYHFKTRFNVTPYEVINNYKNVRWGQETTEKNTWTDGPGTEFILTFLFGEQNFAVYSGGHDKTHVYSYNYHFDISDLQTVEIWDDLEKVHEIIFRYSDDENAF